MCWALVAQIPTEKCIGNCYRGTGWYRRLMSVTKNGLLRVLPRLLLGEIGDGRRSTAVEKRSWSLKKSCSRDLDKAIRIRIIIALFSCWEFLRVLLTYSIRKIILNKTIEISFSFIREFSFSNSNLYVHSLRLNVMVNFNKFPVCSLL